MVSDFISSREMSVPGSLPSASNSAARRRKSRDMYAAFGNAEDIEVIVRHRQQRQRYATGDPVAAKSYFVGAWSGGPQCRRDLTGNAVVLEVQRCDSPIGVR